MGAVRAFDVPPPVRLRRPALPVPAKLRPGGSADLARHAVLQLQRQVGNSAVVHLLQRDAASPRTNPPVTNLHPSGTLAEADWPGAYRAAAQAGSADALRPLFRDIAQTGGLAAMGIDLTSIPVSDGKTARAGLNISMDRADEPGHTGWVDKSGAFGGRIDLSKGAPEPGIAVILSPKALTADKGLSLMTVRHEMVHVLHKQMVLEAVRSWRKSGRGRSLDDWLPGYAKKAKMSAVDLALVKKGAKDAAADTEVLGYIEGFVNDFHRRRPTADEAGPAFFQLLGAVETTKLYTWSQADPAVQKEALARLQAYHATLDPDHQRVWKEWVHKQVTATAKDTTGRRDFVTRLAAFVT